MLGPQSSWRAYIVPRGGHASQDSTGTLITFDTASVASRFAVNNWIQVALATANIRQVSAVGGNSISVSGANLTVAQNDRIFLIGNTQPTVTGGSATYTTPATSIYPRDDDTATALTNSMITSNSDGLIQGWAAPNFYDVIIQDGNRANQGSIVNMEVGAVGGASFGGDVLIGGTLTVNGAIGVTGWATFGSTVTMNAALGVTGRATFGATVTMNAALGVTGWATFGSTITANAAIGVTGHAVFGATITANAALGVTGTATLSGQATFGTTISVGGVTVSVSGGTASVLMGGLLRITNTQTIASGNTISITSRTSRVLLTGTSQINNIILEGVAPAAADDGRTLILVNSDAGNIDISLTGNVAAKSAAGTVTLGSTGGMAMAVWNNTPNKWGLIIQT